MRLLWRLVGQLAREHQELPVRDVTKSDGR
jgi:hypothetical protein